METTLGVELESDQYLISLVRGGDIDAYGRLYERHVAAARRLARVLVRDYSDADDLVAETFTKVLAAMRAGQGPDIAFRAYLLTTLRHALYDRARRDRRVEYTDDMTAYERVSTPDDPLVRNLESSYAARAFARLPERWRTVLWHTEVEGETPAQIAPLLGLTPNGVAALAYRARERLRQMYLQEHIEVTASPRCHWTGTHLAGYVRAALARRDRSKVEDHLAECPQCRVLHRELTEENSGLRGVLAALLLGSAAPGYVAAPAKVAGIAAVMTVLWQTIAGWCADLVAVAAGLAVRLYQLPRRLIERYGPANVAAASGLVVAGLVGVAVFAMVLVRPDNRPPAGDALTRPAPVQSPDVSPTPPPARPTPAISTPPPSTAAADPPTTPQRPPVATAARPAIVADPAEAQLTAAEKGILPIAVRTAESSVQADSLHLGVPLPAGLSLAGSDAGDGWQCRWSDRVHCERALPVLSGHTVARIPISVEPQVSGYQSFPVTVSTGDLRTERTLRVPIAPAGLEVGYAAIGPVGYGLAGNTLLACRPRPACLVHDNNGQEMLPELPGNREPIAPPGLLDPGGPAGPAGQITELAGDKAASGARISVPSTAQVRWAGVEITVSGGKAPDFAALHGPDGGWHPVALTAGPSGQSFADVSGLLREAGGGDWWLAARAADLPTGPGQYAGWSLVAVYDHAGAPPSELAVYLGPKELDTSQALSVQLGEGGTVDVGLVLWDGDRNLVDDSLTLDKTPLGDAANAATGANDSSLICAFSQPDCAWRTPGLDVLRHKGTTSRSGLVTLSAGNDPMAVGLLIVLAESQPPTGRLGSLPVSSATWPRQDSSSSSISDSSTSSTSWGSSASSA